MSDELIPAASKTRKPGSVKVLVWDLDDTLWDGTLLEGDAVAVRPGVTEVLAALDRRGILHSIASKNDAASALEKLTELGLEPYFLYPQIGWSAKSAGIKAIAEAINIGLDAVAFIDDQPFERAEVASALPDVLVLEPAELPGLLDRPELSPRFLTDESAIRRQMYRADIDRKQAEETFEGPTEEFLASLEMRFVLSVAQEEDLQRAEELTVRTNQLNSTGLTFSYEELDRLRQSPDHLLLVASLEDRFGTYGKIGLALVELGEARWRLRLLLMSCRVMSRGVGSVVLSFLLSQAKERGKRFVADFRDTGRNRLMKVAYRFAGFREVKAGDVNDSAEAVLLEHDLVRVPPIPAYVDCRLPEVPFDTHPPIP